MVMNPLRNVEGVEAEVRRLEEDFERLKEKVESRAAEARRIRMTSPKLVWINVRDGDGMLFCKVLVERREKIDMVKLQIEVMKNVPKEQQKLLFMGQELEDTRSVADYDIQDNCAIDLCRPALLTDE